MKIIYLLLLVSSFLSATSKDANSSLIVPNTYYPLGIELNTAYENCAIYQKSINISTEIKKYCSVYNPKVVEVFKIGYSVDEALKNNKNKNEITKKYLFLLRGLDKSKELVLQVIHKEVKEAREAKNFSYYIKLIGNKQVKINSLDYAFMKNNLKIFSDNIRYKQYKLYLESLKNNDTKIVNKVAVKQLKYKKNKYQSKRNNSSKLRNADLISVTYNFNLETRDLSIFYDFKNKRTDEFIEFSNKNLIVNCRVYENKGTFENEDKGAQIGGVSNKILTRSHQTIYITLDDSAYTLATLECNIRMNGKVVYNKRKLHLTEWASPYLKP